MKSSNTFVRKPLVAAISGVLASASPVAMAQDDAGADTIEEILVTASRREQRIEDIPYNISAVDGQAIEDQNVIDTAELMRSISGVSVIDRGFRNAGHVNSLVIRGVNVDNGANGDYGLSAAATESAIQGLPEQFAERFAPEELHCTGRHGSLPHESARRERV